MKTHEYKIDFIEDPERIEKHALDNYRGGQGCFIYCKSRCNNKKGFPKKESGKSTNSKTPSCINKVYLYYKEGSDFCIIFRNK